MFLNKSWEQYLLRSGGGSTLQREMAAAERRAHLACEVTIRLSQFRGLLRPVRLPTPATVSRYLHTTQSLARTPCLAISEESVYRLTSTLVMRFYLMSLPYIQNVVRERFLGRVVLQSVSHISTCHPSPQKQIRTPAQLREPTRTPLLYSRPVTRSPRKTPEGAKREEGGENAVIFL